jgi:GNAT superfamily N-acetyltransferase
MIVRARSGADLDACARVAAAVHHRDGYPRYLPGDLRSFLASRDAYRAWVAERDGLVVGHVALHPRSSAPVMEMASAALGQPPERLGVIARLLVSPDVRGAGAGLALLEAATREALARDLWPVLDVDVDLPAAIALYERCGWTRAGQVSVRFRDGTSLTEYVYLCPQRPARAERHAR